MFDFGKDKILEKLKSDEIYNYYFKKNANEVYNAVEILYTIHNCYPKLDMSRYDDTKYYTSYFYELLSKTKNIDNKILSDICRKYDSSRAPILMSLSSSIKENLLILPKQDVDQSNIYQVSSVKH